VNYFIAALATETNTFSPLPTGRVAFVEREFFRNDGSRKPASLGNIPLIAWRRHAEGDGHTVAESIATFAQPAGTTLRHVYEELRDTLLDDLRKAMPSTWSCSSCTAPWWRMATTIAKAIPWPASVRSSDRMR
jgi:microcystin degradation protein MlrC